MAANAGYDPTPAGSKPAVLPLHQSAVFSVWLTASAAPANPYSAESQIARTGTSFLLKGCPSRTHPLGLLDSFTQAALLYPADSTRQGGTSWICTTFPHVMRKRSTTQATISAGFPPAHRLNYARMPFHAAQRSCGRKEADERREKVGLPEWFEHSACGLQIRSSAN